VAEAPAYNAQTSGSLLAVDNNVVSVDAYQDVTAEFVGIGIGSITAGDQLHNTYDQGTIDVGFNTVAVVAAHGNVDVTTIGFQFGTGYEETPYGLVADHISLHDNLIHVSADGSVNASYVGYDMGGLTGVEGAYNYATVWNPAESSTAWSTAEDSLTFWGTNLEIVNNDIGITAGNNVDVGAVELFGASADLSVVAYDNVTLGMVDLYHTDGALATIEGQNISIGYLEGVGLNDALLSDVAQVSFELAPHTGTDTVQINEVDGYASLDMANAASYVTIGVGSESLTTIIADTSFDASGVDGRIDLQIGGSNLVHASIALDDYVTPYDGTGDAYSGDVIQLDPITGNANSPVIDISGFHAGFNSNQFDQLNVSALGITSLSQLSFGVTGFASASDVTHGVEQLTINGQVHDYLAEVSVTVGNETVNLHNVDVTDFTTNANAANSGLLHSGALINVGTDANAVNDLLTMFEQHSVVHA